MSVCATDHPSGRRPDLSATATTCCTPRALASLARAKARGATLRRGLIDVAARTARHGRGHITLHLPEDWHWQCEWLSLFEAACGPPAAAV